MDTVKIISYFFTEYFYIIKSFLLVTLEIFSDSLVP
jgi:hypothetical protein